MNMDNNTSDLKAHRQRLTSYTGHYRELWQQDNLSSRDIENVGLMSINTPRNPKIIGMGI